MRRIRNRNKLTKEGLIISLLTEHNYMKHFNNNTNDDNNANDDTYDGKISDKISDIRMILSRLGNMVANNYRAKIKKELYEIENKKNLSKKKRIMIILLNLEIL